MRSKRTLRRKHAVAVLKDSDCAHSFQTPPPIETCGSLTGATRRRERPVPPRRWPWSTGAVRRDARQGLCPQGLGRATFFPRKKQAHFSKRKQRLMRSRFRTTEARRRGGFRIPDARCVHFGAREAMSGYATRTRRTADASAKGSGPKVFAREDLDGVRREKKRAKPEDDGVGDTERVSSSKSEKRAAKKARKAAKAQLLAQVMGARGSGGPDSGPIRGDGDDKTQKAHGKQTADDPARRHDDARDSGQPRDSGLPSTSDAQGSVSAKEKRSVKPPKKTKSYGSAELDALAEYVSSLGGAPLAPGWRVESHVRSTDGSKYFYFFNPQNVKFRSKVEAARHYGLFDGFGAGGNKAGGGGKSNKSAKPSAGGVDAKEHGKPKKPVPVSALVSATPGALDSFLPKDDATVATDDATLLPLAANTKKKKKKKKDKSFKSFDGAGAEGGKGGDKKKADADFTKKKKKKKTPTATRSMESYWEQVKVDGEVFRRGDCAYVISHETKDLDEDGDEVCAQCG